MTCFDEDETKQIANFKRKCDGDALDLHTYQEQYSQCLLSYGCEDKWANSKALFWGSLASAFFIGLVVGDKH